jgi:hypothetical protein
MLRKAGILIVAGLLGAGSALGAAGCGEERGSVKFEGDTGGTETATGEAETAETSTTTTEP